MNTREISHEQWVPFLDQFSQAHRGERIEVRVMGAEMGDQTQAADLPLIGITDDPKSSQGECIEVMAGAASAHISHAIAHPVHVRIAERDDGSPVAMQIQSEDGTSTLVRFLTPGESA
jgi:Family of unknown function (DUF5335)